MRENGACGTLQYNGNAADNFTAAPVSRCDGC